MPITVLEQLAGLCLVALILLDIFVTVLYARAGTGIIAPHAERLLWRLIRWISAISNRLRDRILSLGGPVLLVAIVAMWFGGLALGAALDGGLRVTLRRQDRTDTAIDAVTGRARAAVSMTFYTEPDA